MIILQCLCNTIVYLDQNALIIALILGTYFDAGSTKTNIKPSRYKCSGNVEIYHEDQWVPVCKESLKSIATQNAICAELKCGQAFKIIDYFGINTTSHVISELQCPQNGSDTLKDCNNNVASSGTALCTLGGLQCSSMYYLSLSTTN